MPISDNSKKRRVADLRRSDPADLFLFSAALTTENRNKPSGPLVDCLPGGR
jgi:hypothetical protein